MFRRYQSFSVAVATCRLNDLSVTVMFTSYVDEMYPAKAALYLQERQLFPRPLLFRTQFLSDVLSPNQSESMEILSKYYSTSQRARCIQRKVSAR